MAPDSGDSGPRVPSSRRSSDCCSHGDPQLMDTALLLTILTFIIAMKMDSYPLSSTCKPEKTRGKGNIT